MQKRKDLLGVHIVASCNDIDLLVCHCIFLLQISPVNFVIVLFIKLILKFFLCLFGFLDWNTAPILTYFYQPILIVLTGSLNLSSAHAEDTAAYMVL